jgi:hypothetical protein
MFALTQDNAIISEFDPETNEYCNQERCWGGDYRAPEEFMCDEKLCSEQTDTYIIGHLIYRQVVNCL